MSNGELKAKIMSVLNSSKDLPEAKRRVSALSLSLAPADVDSLIKQTVANAPAHLPSDDFIRYINTTIRGERFKPLTGSQRGFRRMVEESNWCYHAKVHQGMSQKEMQEVMRECSSHVKGQSMPRTEAPPPYPSEKIDELKQFFDNEYDKLAASAMTKRDKFHACYRAVQTILRR